MNKIHHKKINKIMNSPTPISIKRLKPLFEFKNKKKDGGLTREQKLEIKAGNKYFRKKITTQSSFYSHKKWENDFGNTKNFKKNICQYPFIDFSQTRKNPNVGPISYFNSRNGFFNSKINNNFTAYFKKTKFIGFNSLLNSYKNEERSKSQKEDEKNKDNSS